MIVYNNETIKNAIMDALDKMERGIEVDRNELIDLILKYGDMYFGIKNKDTGKYYTEEELQNSVYIHIVNKNNKCYIGQTSRNPKDRWQRNGIEYNGQVFYNPIKKHEWVNISHIVICNGLSKEEANNMEIQLISIFKSSDRKFGYNVEHGGNGVGKMSEETINKLREGKKGGNNPRAKAVYCGEMIFPTMRQCAKFYNVNHKTMTYWLKHTDKTPSEFIKLGLRVATEEDVKNYPICTEESSEDNKVMVIKEGGNYVKKVYCNGMIFKSITQCAKFYNVSDATISKCLNEKVKRYSKLLSEFIELGLRFATEEDINTYPIYNRRRTKVTRPIKTLK